jgi:hypothetical protein
LAVLTGDRDHIISHDSYWFNPSCFHAAFIFIGQYSLSTDSETMIYLLFSLQAEEISHQKLFSEKQIKPECMFQ